MRQLLSIVLAVVLLLCFNYANASIVNTIIQNDTNGNNFQLKSYAIDYTSENLGRIILDGIEYYLPQEIELKIGNSYVIGYMPVEGYIFDHWEIEGGELKMDKTQQTNIFKVTKDNGKIIAVYKSIVEKTKTTTETMTIEEYELPLGKFISLSMHEIVEEHKGDISEWILDYTLLISENDAEKLEKIENYQNELEQNLLDLKNEKELLNERLKNNEISEEEFVIQMEVLNSRLNLRLIKNNEKIKNIIEDISKEVSNELIGKMEKIREVNSQFRNEMENLKKEIKEEVKQKKLKSEILATSTTFLTTLTTIEKGKNKENTKKNIEETITTTTSEKGKNEKNKDKKP